ncbi:MAG: hypothetical protein JWP95_618 [Actinotalea sp.]|nr:hypothetical protein [Actinotalea sp.]
MTPAEHGPGVVWLAERVGCPPEGLLADPERLVTALRDAARDVGALARRLGATDPAVLRDAEREAADLRARITTDHDPADRFRGRAVQALRDATARVRDEPRREA